MAKALSAGFHRFIHLEAPLPVGSRLRTTRYKHLRAACSLGKWPRARVARRNLAWIDSIAFVDRVRNRYEVFGAASLWGEAYGLVVGLGASRRNS